jgi:hypothetical protein
MIALLLRMEAHFCSAAESSTSPSTVANWQQPRIQRHQQLKDNYHHHTRRRRQNRASFEAFVTTSILLFVILSVAVAKRLYYRPYRRYLPSFTSVTHECGGALSQQSRPSAAVALSATGAIRRPKCISPCRLPFTYQDQNQNKPNNTCWYCNAF